MMWRALLFALCGVGLVAQTALSTQPKTYFSMGGGIIVPGSGKFGYWSVSQYVGQGTYLTAANEYTLSKGQVLNCSLGGASKALYEFGRLTIGITGLGGGCNSTAGSSGGAAATQGFLKLHIKGALSGVATFEKLFVTTDRQAAQLTLGIMLGKK